MEVKKTAEYVGTIPVDKVVKFVGVERFWCGRCDCHSVVSDEPATGKFFSQFGHTSNGDFVRIVWAVCSKCLDESNSYKNQ